MQDLYEKKTLNLKDYIMILYTKPPIIKLKLGILEYIDLTGVCPYISRDF